MKKVCNIIIIFIIAINILIVPNRVQAADIWDVGKDWIDTGIEEKKGGTFDTWESGSKAKFEELIDFLWGLGLLVAAITTVVLGIKLMTVPPGEKSRVKQSISPYVVGIIIIFGALSIWKLLINVLDGNL